MTNTINLFVLSFSYPIVNWKKNEQQWFMFLREVFFC